MSKKIMKSMSLILCLVMASAFCLTACTKGGSNEPASSASGFTGEKYVNDGKDFSIKTEDLPAGYAFVPNDTFEAAVKSLGESITTSSTYEDVAKAFGDDGVKMNGIQYSGYAYYSWYSDKDYKSDTKVNVLITFKVSGNKMTYYAYSANGFSK